MLHPTSCASINTNLIAVLQLALAAKDNWVAHTHVTDAATGLC